MYSALRATCESKPHPETRTHTRMSGAGCIDLSHSPTTRVHCRQMVDGTTARSTAPCLAMAAASQARAPAHLLAHPMSPHHPSPSESASALSLLLKCASRRARAAGARSELLSDGAVRRERVRDAGGSVGRAASAIAMHSDAGRASMWTLCACWSSFCAAVAGPECRIRRPIVLGDYWDRPTAFGVRGVCVERVYVKTRECAPPRAAPSRVKVLPRARRESTPARRARRDPR